MKISEILKYYSRDEVKEAILREAKNREIAAKFRDGGFGKRPQVLRYKSDLDEWVRNGAVSFHMSEERWVNPMALSQDMGKKEMDNIRAGWDLVLDVDTKVFEYGKICAHLILKALEYHDVKNIFAKFSGGTGWHIAVPFETFPESINNAPVSSLFPEAAQNIAKYLMNMISERLSREIMDFSGSLEEVSKTAGKKQKELFVDGDFDPFSVISIDSVAIASRHLLRMPYSLNEKTWLISVPVEKKDVPDFDLKMAREENVAFDMPFITRSGKKGEAKWLFSQSYDFVQKMEAEETLRKDLGKDYKIPERAIPEEFFPPCIKKILMGVEDGRKRSVFVLATFLRLVGWNQEMIEKKIGEWNKRNKEPLRPNYIKTQLNWYARNPGYLPPNCDNKGYYRDMKVCFPDEMCKQIKNPVTYTFKSQKYKRKNVRKE
jgi:DNA primase catalytic subunit